MLRVFQLCFVVTAACASLWSNALSDRVSVRTDFDRSKGTAVVWITNQSGKDITAYNVTTTTTYANGKQDTSSQMSDLLQAIISEQELGRPLPRGGAFRDGQTRELQYTITTSLPDEVSGVNAVVDVVVYADNKAEVLNDEAFARIISFRRDAARTTTEAANIIKKHVADSQDKTPDISSVAELKQRLEQSKTRTHDLLDTQLLSIISDLEERRRLSPDGVPGEYLKEYIGKQEERAMKMLSGSHVEVAKGAAQ